jgi:hypothetical protein
VQNEAPNIPFVRIWNNQFQQLEDGETYAFPFPNVFFEIESPAAYNPLALNYSIADIKIRVHIGHEEYDAGNGLYEQNTNVFLLRNQIISILNNFQPSGCSSMMKVGEIQDYEHKNIYHYIVEFLCSFVDTAAVDMNPTTGVITEIAFTQIGSGDPRGDIDVVNNIPNQPNEQYREYEL